ncbi:MULTISPECIES: virulence factor Mce family protein [Mycolicibacterium]|uniref:Mammalian cell entry protein n=1 Tax=Mycolicibacterium phlei DSM 43239 = CCUG 21000 TaxID=1226750 RepID=A0A5N5UQQ6_MYCPH|nr:virulence factor Mce family protein [Mycolicibacterium phlei RIVM601174]KAB7751905.1 mammalian cell entry protein [Mycolicibacterium phlei DSM 43239 = CCUG 21000]KXW60502.1 mammalian cell entry protein [Mycolicibacterium phlei DSM 43239 = CCUG 21000]MBF4193920.1 virulence factor Mce family protein [Mycolicibacterium phlei]
MRRRALAAVVLAIALVATGCGWRGLNSVPLPGVEGVGPGAFTIQAQMPDVDNIEQNSRVRVGDVNVGTVTKIERQDWHALVTMKLNGNVELPANAIARVGQTSLLGSQHIELSPPTDEAPQGRLHEGSLIPLKNAGAYPTTEQALAAVALLLNGGGFGNLQDITEALSTAFADRENDLRSLIEQLDKAIGYLDDQKNDIIETSESLNNLMGQLADQKPVIDKALRTIPDALAVLKDQRQNLSEALVQLGRFSALAADSVDQTKEALVAELKQLGPTLQSLADAGPALTRALSFLPTFPFPKETLLNWMRGDYANLTLVVDMTLSRIDAGFFTGTRWECNLTWLELQWGRTIGQMPSPCNHHVPPPGGNPLLKPYRWDQGP